jgi:hypothetical protein
MALILKDRVKETTITTGTSSFALDGAVTGYQAFSAAIGDGNTTYYAVYLDNSTEWEVGIGTYSSSGNTLARTTILASSNAGSIVTFSAGTKQIWCDYPAGKAVYANAAGNIDSASLTSPKINEILDTNGNEILGLSPTTSATDFLTVKNGIGVGVPLHIYADGSSTNVGLHIQPKGTGLVTISDGTDFNKGIRFRSSGSAASAVTLLDAVATAGRVVTLPDATTTLVGKDTTDTLTNKSISGSTNTLSNIGNSSLTNSAITINGTSTSLGGSISVGSVTSIDATVPSIFSVSGVPITGSGTIAMTYSGTALPIANGGTNSTATATAGGAAYGTGTAYAVTAAGSTGQILQSNGASAPTWSNRTQYLGVLLSGGSTTQVPTSNGFLGVLLSNGSTTTQVPIS